MQRAGAAEVVAGRTRTCYHPVMTWSVVIVAWRSAAQLPGCLDALAQSRGVRITDVVIINNSREVPVRPGPAGLAVQVVTPPCNLGFARAANLGFARTRGEWVLFLNPDAQVDGDCLAHLQRTLVQGGAPPAVGPVLLPAVGDRCRGDEYSVRPPSLPQIMLFHTPLRFVARRVGRWRRRWWSAADGLPGGRPGDDDPAPRVDHLPGACLALARRTFASVGGFDPGFFLWFEDVDLSVRLRQAGVVLRRVAAARARHQGGHAVRQLTAAERGRLWDRSFRRYRRRHFSVARQRAADAILAVAAVLRAGREVLTLGRSAPGSCRRLAAAALGRSPRRTLPPVAGVPAVRPTEPRARTTPPSDDGRDAGGGRRPCLGIAVTTCGGVDRVRRCLASLAANGSPAPVVVVDSAASRALGAMLAGEFPGVRFLPRSGNRGFAAAANHGLRAVFAQPAVTACLLLNDDATLRPGGLAALAAALAHYPRFDVFAPEVRDAGAPDRLASRGIAWSAWGARDLGFAFPVGRGVAPPAEVFAPSGCATLMRRRAFARVGAYDPAFFMYFEDAELGLRLRAAGLRTLSVPQAIVDHEGAASIGRWSEARFVHLRKSAALLAVRALHPVLAIRLLARQALRLLTGTGITPRRAESPGAPARFCTRHARRRLLRLAVGAALSALGARARRSRRARLSVAEQWGWIDAPARPLAAADRPAPAPPAAEAPARRERGRADDAPIVTAVVVSGGNVALARDCLRSLRRAAGLTGGALVMDNGPPGDVTRQLQETCRAPSGFDVITTGRNLGFAAAANAGINEALARGADFVLLLNDDARPAPAALGPLVAQLQADPTLAAVGPRVFSPAGSLACDGTFVITALAQSFHRRAGRRAPRTPLLRPVPYLPGAAVLIRREAWGDIGGFDERFFLYFEDWDWARRAARRGWRLGVVRSARAVHVGGASAGEDSPVKRTWMTRSRLRFAGKHLARPTYWLCFAPVFAIRHVALPALRLLAAGRGAELHGLRAGLTARG